jgi:hypothetical protein
MMMEEGSRRKIEKLSQRKFSDGVNELALHLRISVENFIVNTEERRDGSYRNGSVITMIGWGRINGGGLLFLASDLKRD